MKVEGCGDSDVDHTLLVAHEAVDYMGAKYSDEPVICNSKHYKETVSIPSNTDARSRGFQDLVKYLEVILIRLFFPGSMKKTRKLK